jgi:hypothetical protein
MRWIALLLIAGFSLFSADAYGQNQPVVPPTPPVFDAKFFEALKTLFDDFSSSDLQRAFQAAQPIRCSELLGEWRPAAFFNDDRNLERWFHQTFDEVQAELARYSFRGRCDSESASVDVTSRYPIRESVDDYNLQKISFDKIAYKANAAVGATFDSRARTYKFSLPYLYLIGRKDGTNQYSLVPPNSSLKPAEEVTNDWNCKAVKSADSRYRFLLCRTVIVPRNAALRSQADAVQGTSAYVVLSDGREAVSTISLSFENSPAPASPGKTVSMIADLGREKFRLQFARRSWEDKIDSVMALIGGRLEFPETVTAAKNDYCEWIPQSPATARVVNDPDKTVEYYLATKARDGSTPATVSFEARTSANARLGTLRCFFPNDEVPVILGLDRLKPIFGEHVSVELR